MEIFTGCVENRQDPLRLGRCQVRITGLHTKDKIELPTEDLPWALPIQPITSAAMNGIGYSPLGPVEGTWVAIMFQDEFQQQPLMLGTIGGIPQKEETPHDVMIVRIGCEDEVGGDSNTAVTTAEGEILEEARFEEEFESIERIPNEQEGFKDPTGKYPKYVHEPDTNRLARGELPPAGATACIDETIVAHKIETQTKGVPIANGGSWDQPENPYDAEYPHNHVYESESGHIREYDDSPGRERFHQWHKTGTFTEIDSNGTQVNKIVGDGFTIIERNGHLFVVGAYYVTVDGAHHLKVNDTVDVEIEGKTTINCYNDVEWNIQGKMDLNVKEELNVKAKEINMESYELGTHINSADVINTESAQDTNIYSHRDLNTTSLLDTNIVSTIDLNTTSFVDTNMTAMLNKNVTVLRDFNTEVMGKMDINVKELYKLLSREHRTETYEFGIHLNSEEELRGYSKEKMDFRSGDHINIDGVEVHINEDLADEAEITELIPIGLIVPDLPALPENANDSGLAGIPSASGGSATGIMSMYEAEPTELEELVSIEELEELDLEFLSESIIDGNIIEIATNLGLDSVEANELVAVMKNFDTSDVLGTVVGLDPAKKALLKKVADNIGTFEDVDINIGDALNTVLEADPEKLVKSISGLENLSLKELRNIPQETLKEIATQNPELEDLSKKLKSISELKPNQIASIAGLDIEGAEEAASILNKALGKLEPPKVVKKITDVF